MMERNDRRHRVLAALAGRPLRINVLKVVAADNDAKRNRDRARTWDTICQLAENGLVLIRHGEVALTPAGDTVLQAAEQAWAQAGAV